MVTVSKRALTFETRALVLVFQKVFSQTSLFENLENERGYHRKYIEIIELRANKVMTNKLIINLLQPSLLSQQQANCRTHQKTDSLSSIRLWGLLLKNILHIRQVFSSSFEVVMSVLLVTSKKKKIKNNLKYMV